MPVALGSGTWGTAGKVLSFGNYNLQQLAVIRSIRSCHRITYNTSKMEQQGLCSICQFTGPLNEVEQHFINEHVDNDGIAAAVDNNDDEINVPTEADSTKKKQFETDTARWAPQDVLLLIRLVEENDSKFENSLKKHVWMHISKKISGMTGKTITPEQVDNKWKGLRKTYKKLKDHNNKTGSGTAPKWEFFNAMDNCLAKRPEITPVAVCDTASGLTINKVDVRASNQLEDAGPSSSQSGCSSVMQKRKRLTNDVQKRHHEKLARYDEFLRLFKQSVEHQIGKKPE